MVETPTAAPKPLLRDPRFYLGSALIFVVIYVGWIFFHRYEENQALQRKAIEERTEKQRESDRAAIDQLGGSDFAIRHFYLTHAEIRRGDSSQLCYGVANAKTITLDPPDGRVWPSSNHCVDIKPKKTTTYTLTITSDSGQTQSANLTLTVK